ncbi:MAG: hypothetical protein MJ161_06675 [Clostridia bacterium]|nr:hypothetical protein [Clostridia bacterium]
MKKIVIALLAVILVFGLTACGGGSGGTQEVSFQGITMEIPLAWKAEKDTLSDDYAIYEQLNKEGHDYRLLMQDTFGLLETFGGDMDGAGKFFKEVTEDDASYSDVSDPVAGKFGDYDMHTITCTLNMLNPTKDDLQAKYPCKLIRIYMGDHDVELEFSAQEGDFEAFDQAFEAATCK